MTEFSGIAAHSDRSTIVFNIISLVRPPKTHLKRPSNVPIYFVLASAMTLFGLMIARL